LFKRAARFVKQADGSSVRRGPRRIVCLTEETTETLYLLGEQDRIVGISGFTVRPPRARREKPRVAAFTSARIEVHIFNQRSVEEILAFIRMLGGMVCALARAEALLTALQDGLDQARAAA